MSHEIVKRPDSNDFSVWDVFGSDVGVGSGPENLKGKSFTVDENLVPFKKPVNMSHNSTGGAFLEKVKNTLSPSKSHSVLCAFRQSDPTIPSHAGNPGPHSEGRQLVGPPPPFRLRSKAPAEALKRAGEFLERKDLGLIPRDVSLRLDSSEWKGRLQAEAEEKMKRSPPSIKRVHRGIKTKASGWARSEEGAYAE